MDPTPPKRGRGRPPGSKNKPKPWHPALTESPSQGLARGVAETAAAADPSAPGPTDTASLLAYHHARLAEIRDDLATVRRTPGALPRDVALFRNAEDRALKAIGELTGATKITEAKIIASDAWRGMFAEIVMVLGKHPAALADLKNYLEPHAAPNAGRDAPK